MGTWRAIHLPPVARHLRFCKTTGGDIIGSPLHPRVLRGARRKRGTAITRKTSDISICHGAAALSSRAHAHNKNDDARA